MLNNKKKKKGFTLIELIIVIAIIAILAAVALPKFGDVRKKANISADIANAKQIQSAVSVIIANDEVSLPSTTDKVSKFTLDGEAEAATDKTDIETKTIQQLQGAIPVMKTGANKGNKFYVEVTSDGVVTIKTAASGGVEIYPNGKGDYVN